jgi:hypothetical protein
MKERIGRVEQLLDALRRVAAGECVIDRAVVEELLARRHQTDPLDALTPREREILALIPKAAPTAASAKRSGSAQRRLKRTSEAPSQNSESEKRPKTTGACSPSSPT